MAVILGACGGTPPTPPPTDTSLTVTPSTMDGVTTATLQVRAPAAWELDAEATSAALADAFSFAPPSGFGDDTATLAVDPLGLAPGTYEATVVLRAERATGGTVEVRRTVTFSFPDVEGVVVTIGATGTSSRSSNGTSTSAVDVALADAGSDTGFAAFPAIPLATEASAARPAARDGRTDDRSGVGTAEDAVDAGEAGRAGEDGATYLHVGLEAADPVLRASGSPGRPSTRALDTLALELAAVDGTAITSRFDAAGLAIVRVPAGADRDLADKLRAAPGVRYVEVPQPLYPFSNDEYRHLQWNLDRVGAEVAWQVADGSGVTIAILDIGFYPAHSDLASNVAGTYDAIDGRSDITVPFEDCGTHGTHVAGVAAAVTDNGIGVAGTARGADLLLVDLGDESQVGCPMDTTRLIDGLQYVTNGGSPRAEVANLSLGTSNDLGQDVRDALIATKNAGITIIGSAGNTQCTNGADTFVPVSYPAAYPEVLAIGATGTADERACYSHIGAELWLVAPGGNSARRDDTADMILSTVYDFAYDAPDYSYMEGTSMASPAVAAVAAMLKDAVPGATPDEIAQAMADSAVDLGDGGFDNLFGYGLVNAPAALAELTGGPEPEPEPDPDPEPDPATLYLRVPGYPDSQLDDDGIFILVDAPLGPLTITAGSDENGNGVLGDAGEYYGQATVMVAFDQPNQVTVEVERQ
ncbi:MAG: S8 family serine peptidase [Trueperaceae bacterium]